ncbi:SH3 domain-containing protein [Tepidibacter mesophilus]|uniref:SH3 domain-containing protein n=1 Tax=Tepidibacter mesophilus TaxID=655607 RepID=UPI000C0687BD|nr:SH3 domain-containing protein [Tepidibacter mesophilus]
MKNKILSCVLIALFTLTAIYSLSDQKAYAHPENGKCGYVAKSFLKYESEGGSIAIATVQLDDTESWSYLNVRKTPSVNSKVVAKLNHGHKVKVIKSSEETVGGITWVWINY